MSKQPQVVWPTAPAYVDAFSNPMARIMLGSEQVWPTLLDECFTWMEVASLEVDTDSLAPPDMPIQAAILDCYTIGDVDYLPLLQISAVGVISYDRESGQASYNEFDFGVEDSGGYTVSHESRLTESGSIVVVASRSNPNGYLMSSLNLHSGEIIFSKEFGLDTTYGIEGIPTHRTMANYGSAPLPSNSRAVFLTRASSEITISVVDIDTGSELHEGSVPLWHTSYHLYTASISGNYVTIVMQGYSSSQGSNQVVFYQYDWTSGDIQLLRESNIAQSIYNYLGYQGALSPGGDYVTNFVTQAGRTFVRILHSSDPNKDLEVELGLACSPLLITSEHLFIAIVDLPDSAERLFELNKIELSSGKVTKVVSSSEELMEEVLGSEVGLHFSSFTFSAGVGYASALLPAVIEEGGYVFVEPNSNAVIAHVPLSGSASKVHELEPSDQEGEYWALNIRSVYGPSGNHTYLLYPEDGKTIFKVFEKGDCGCDTLDLSGEIGYAQTESGSEVYGYASVAEEAAHLLQTGLNGLGGGSIKVCEVDGVEVYAHLSVFRGTPSNPEPSGIEFYLTAGTSEIDAPITRGGYTEYLIGGECNEVVLSGGDYSFTLTRKHTRSEAPADSSVGFFYEHESEDELDIQDVVNSLTTAKVNEPLRVIELPEPGERFGGGIRLTHERYLDGEMKVLVAMHAEDLPDSLVFAYDLADIPELDHSIISTDDFEMWNKFKNLEDPSRLPAAEFCLTSDVGGYTDWMLPGLATSALFSDNPEYFFPGIEEYRKVWTSLYLGGGTHIYTRRVGPGGSGTTFASLSTEAWVIPIRWHTV